MAELKSWGVAIEGDCKKSADWNCPVCGWSYFYEKTPEKFQNIVGFTKNYPMRSTQSGVVGAFVIRCPKCETKFWFHTSMFCIEAIEMMCGAYKISWPPEND